MKGNQNGLYGLHFSANIVNTDIMPCAFPRDLEKLTQMFENFLKAMRISSVIPKGKKMMSETKAR